MAALLQPQEVEVFYILPALRREIAIAMKAHGMKQNAIAKILHIENAAVSQYISGKRGNKIRFPNDVKKLVAESTTRIKDATSLLSETQKILRYIRASGALCTIHHQVSTVPLNCGKNQMVICEGD